VVTKLDYQSVMVLYAVREVLESTAAALAARNASDMEILALGDMLELEEQILEDAGKLGGPQSPLPRSYLLLFP
jgi:DNA-binding GntR family transcriptional regulator